MKVNEIRKQSDIPSSVEELKALLWSAVVELTNVRNENILLRKGVFGRKSEKQLVKSDAAEQLRLEALLALIPHVATTLIEQPITAVATIGKTRRKKHPGRNSIPDTIPVEYHRIDTAEDNTVCTCCGKGLVVLEEVERSVIERTPATYTKHVYVRIKRVCRSCKDTVIVADPPLVTPIEKGKAGIGLLLFVIISKHQYHLPLYRIQRQIYHESHIWFTRSTMVGWIAQLCVPLQRIYTAMMDELKRCSCIHSDDTRVKRVTQCSYMWVYVDSKATVAIFDYKKTRGADAPRMFLKDSAQGTYLMVDGYAAYNQAVEKYQLISLACMMHIRREFVEAVDCNSEKEFACTILKLIGKLYRIERFANEKGLSDQRRLELRIRCSKPIMKKIKDTLQAPDFLLLPQNKITKAIKYALNCWERAERYLHRGDLPIDNGLAERVIRDLTIGRKNWNGVGSDNGGKYMAILYSIIQTCKLLAINPEEYLKDILMRTVIRPNSVSVADLTPAEWLKARNNGILPQQKTPLYPSVN